MKKMLVALLAASAVACSPSQDSRTVHRPKASHTPVKNVIFLIGDGMGLAAVTKAMQQSDKPLNLERAHAIGLIKTNNASGGITDSAASATAYSIGVKTNNGAVGVDASGRSKKTLLESLAAKGYATGLIATSTITHATPASFYAHVESREDHYSIAEQLVDAPVTLFIGGAEDYFDKRNNKKKGKPDDRNLLTEMRSKGVSFVNTLSALSKTSGRVGFFTAGEHPASLKKGRSDYLPKSIQPSIDYLSKESKKGFFMMVEGSQIDWGAHENDLEYTLDELLEFDKAVGEAMDFADKNRNTLVIITADHETGGLTLPALDADGKDPYAKIGHAFSTDGHTAAMVPVYVYGKGAAAFSGIYENTAIHKKILDVMGK